MGLASNFKKASWPRKVIRETLALAFWMHAMYLTGLLTLPGIANPNLPRYAYNSVLLVFIVNYSLFSENGWWSVLFDLIYIYFLPFIYVGKVCQWIAKLSAKSFTSRVIWQNPQLLRIPINTVTPHGAPAATKADNSIRSSAKLITSRRAARLFFKFSLLWSLLILTVNSKIFLSFAVFVTALGASRAIFSLWGLFSGQATWLEKVELAIATVIAQWTAKIEAWDKVSNPEEIRQAINNLKIYRSVLNFIADNTSFLASWAFTASIVISIPFYCYISLLFSCMYFGIAKISGLNFPIQQALVDSLFMPFAWSSLPPNLLIKLIAGMQATCVSIIGYNILFRHIGNRLVTITKAAMKLRDPLGADPLITILSQAESALSRSYATSAAKPAEG